MERESFRRGTYVLGKEYSIDILEYIHSEGWSKASDIAEELDIHIATCSQYLKELWELDILEKRKVQAKTRMVDEFRVKDPKIELDYDLTASSKPTEKKKGIYRELFDSIFERTRKMYGSTPIKRDAIDIDSLTDEELSSLLRELLENIEKRMGLHSTQKLVKSAGIEVLNKHNNKDEDEQIFADIPSKYLDMLEGGKEDG